MKYILYVHVHICSFIASILCDKCFTRINKLLYCIVLYCIAIQSSFKYLVLRIVYAGTIVEKPNNNSVCVVA